MPTATLFATSLLKQKLNVSQHLMEKHNAKIALDPIVTVQWKTAKQDKLTATAEILAHMQNVTSRKINASRANTVRMIQIVTILQLTAKSFKDKENANQQK